jgi:hypothetical protein
VLVLQQGRAEQGGAGGKISDGCNTHCGGKRCLSGSRGSAAQQQQCGGGGGSDSSGGSSSPPCA